MREVYDIAYQGVAGSFGNIAALKYTHNSSNALACKHFCDVFDSLEQGKAICGILPIENSTTGGVATVYDLLIKYGYYIIDEVCIKIEHNLLGVKGTKLEDIRYVYSHPQAIMQSEEYLQSNNWDLIPYTNTAASAKYISECNDKTKAAVASIKASEIYDLAVLSSNINSNNSNYTRFIVIGSNLVRKVSNDKISIVVSVPHKAGALCNILKHFSENSINLLKIESRPIKDKPWEYLFHIDFEGNLNNSVVIDALKNIKENSCHYKLLGNYKSYNG
ncbi:prephenate dehydratase [Abyssisolibacter fermentans]|uniref:prephenate dehydratase n=1 Tax=Abyssisolibacter fermentans TaxID=1766203 RepID=UPI00082F7567|nr:prephenate dehydratase [Abyssisolibacter fermentans]